MIVLGPTATGKTRLAVQLANALDGEVVSVDSRQVYRGLDIGSGKDLHEYGSVPNHLIDVAEIQQEYSLFNYLCDCRRVLKSISKAGRLPLFAGGTGLYLDALLNAYRLLDVPSNELLREELRTLTQQQLITRLTALKPVHNSTDTDDRERTVRAIEIAEAELSGAGQSVQIKLLPYIVGIRCSGDGLRCRIAKRLHARLASGMVEEVAQLKQKGISWQRLDQLGLEYRLIAQHLKGDFSFNDMQQKLASAIYQFARQQNKWFRRMERKGHLIHWIDSDSIGSDTAEQIASQYRAWPVKPGFASDGQLT